MDKNTDVYGPAIARAWEDDSFKQRLIDNPKAALTELGLPFPADRDVVVLEQAANTSYLIIPPKPSSGELSDDLLDKVAGGACCPYGSMYTYPNSG